MKYLARQKDAAGARGKAGRGGGKLAERGKETIMPEEAILLEKLEHSGRFAAGHDQPIQAGEFRSFAHQHRPRSGVLEDARVRLVIALEGEHADSDWIAFAGAFQRRSVCRGCHRFPCSYDTGGH